MVLTRVDGVLVAIEVSVTSTALIMLETWFWSTTVCPELHSPDEFYENPTHSLLALQLRHRRTDIVSTHGFLYFYFSS